MIVLEWNPAMIPQQGLKAEDLSRTLFLAIIQAMKPQQEMKVALGGQAPSLIASTRQYEIVSQERYLPPLGATRCYADGTCGPAGYEPIPPGTTWCDNDGCTTVGYNTIPPHTTGDYHAYICQCDCEEVLDCLESASGTPTWKHSFALGSDDIFKP